MAEKEGLDLNALQGTGPNDRIIKADVEEALKSGGAKEGKKRPAAP